MHRMMTLLTALALATGCDKLEDSARMVHGK